MGALVPVPFHLPGHHRREQERELRQRVELQVAQTEAMERIRAQILAEREAAAAGPARVTLRRALLAAAWRNRGFLAPFLLLPALALAGWWSFWTVLAWLATAGLWWARGHMPRDWAAPAAEPAWEPLPEPDTIPRRWATNLGAEGCRFAGSRIVDTRVGEHADKYRVQLVPGRQTVEDVGAALPLVSSGTRMPVARIVWEPDPQLRDEDSTVGLLSVLRRPPAMEEVRYFREPRFRNGAVLLGDHVDHDGQAAWQVYVKNGMKGGIIVGDSEGGKSRTLDSLAATVMSPEWQALYPTHIAYIDGQNGASSPHLWEHATLRATLDDADEFLNALLRMFAARQAWNVAHDLQGFTPGKSPREGVEGLAGWLVIADEPDEIWPQQKVARWAHIPRRMRKVGGALISSGQDISLTGFGDDDTFRTNLAAGNAAVFRIGSNIATNRLPGLPQPPHTIPKIPGYFVMIPGRDARARTAPARADYSPTAEEKSEASSIPYDVPTLDDQFARGVHPPVCDMDARALGVVYSQREERAAAQMERARAIAEGRELPPERERIAIVRALPAAAEPEATAEQVTTTRGAILAYLRVHGRTKRADLVAHAAKELGTSADAVTKALAALAGKKEIERFEGGFYDLASAANTDTG
jgi:hypothetical protein